MSEQDLDKKAVEIVRKVQAKGNPVTIASLARRLRVGQRAALQLCEDNGLNINVGFSIPGAGYAIYSRIAEYSVEDLSAPYQGD